MNKIIIVMLAFIVMLPVIAVESPSCPSSFSEMACQDLLQHTWDSCLKAIIPIEMCQWEYGIINNWGWDDSLYGSDAQPLPPTIPLPPVTSVDKTDLPPFFEYTVKRGDNWYYIAREFDIDVESIWELNSIDDPSRAIHAGNTFLIPCVPCGS